MVLIVCMTPAIATAVMLAAIVATASTVAPPGPAQYTQQALTNQSTLQALLLPVMLVVVGGIVGLAVMAIFLPIPAMIQSATGM